MSAEKLFDVRTFEGTVNHSAISDIREIERSLNCYPPFIGIAVRGSTTRGYSTDSSDLDLVLLYDSNVHFNTENEEKRFYHIRMSAWHCFITDSRRVEMTEKDINPGRLLAEVPIIPADIYRLVTGHKITKYRSLYADYIGQFPKNRIDMIVDELAGELTRDDSIGWKKMAERRSGVHMSDFSGDIDLYFEVLKANGVTAPRNVYEEERMRLWRARIKSFLKNCHK